MLPEEQELIRLENEKTELEEQLTTACINAQMLKGVRNYADKFTASLPTCIQAAALTSKSKLPFKSLAIRDLLFHRATELTNVAADPFEGGSGVEISNEQAVYWFRKAAERGHCEAQKALEALDIDWKK